MNSPFAGHHAGTRHTANDRSALTAVSQSLCCPHCASAPLRVSARTVTCPAGHSFDIARHGYASLITGRRRPHPGDRPDMVAARERFLGGDHYRPLRSTITALAVEHAPPGSDLIVDLAGGTGHYLAAALDAAPPMWGLAMDVSGAASRRAARAHPRAAAVAADLWQPLPVVTGSAGVVLSVFGPRPAEEISRVLTADGVLVVAHAMREHLRELRDGLGTIGVDPRKAERMSEAFRGFEQVADQTVTWRLALDHTDARALITMGPSAHHLEPDRLSNAVEHLPDLVGVTAAIQVTVLRRAQ